MRDALGSTVELEEGTSMDRLRALLSDPIWWFTTVVAGMVVNLGAGFLKDGLDRVRERTYAELGRRKTAKDAKDLELATRAAADPVRVQGAMTLALMALVQFGTALTAFLLLSVVAILFGQGPFRIVLVVLALLSGLLSTIQGREARASLHRSHLTLKLYVAQHSGAEGSADEKR
jgi:hypothetical protein